MSNAVKFTEQGFISVEGYEENDTLIISVADTGIGMDEEKAESLFQAFVQADSDMNRTYGGMGLGLSIAHYLVQEMSGSIDISSRIGHGTNVRIVLPLDKSNDTPASKQLNLSRTAFNYHVIVVDDSPLIES